MRIFSRKQRIFLYTFQDGKCNHCKCELNYEYEADHILEWSKGGQTTIENGQLLCKQCHKEKTKMQKELQLREWQVQGLEKFERIIESNKDKMLVVATPGAGKTVFASKCMEKFYDMHNGNVLFIVLVPNKSLQKDWAESAWRSSAGKINISYSKPLNKGLNFGDHIGTVSCYQSVNEDAIEYTKHGFYWAKTKGIKVMVVFDEAHHMAIENEWGKAANEMFASADFYLSISGTPFRTDKEKIPFFEYDADGRLVPAITYTYAEAIRDNVCRDVVFKSTEGEIEFYAHDGEIIKTGIDLESIDDKYVSQVVHLTLDPTSEIVRHLIIEASNKLNEIRSGEHKDAGGIVFCKSINHAKQIAQKFYEYTGEQPFVVHSELDEALKEIEQFKRSKDKWIISVSMISEGKDIQRLRVGLWLSNISAELKLIQSLGRVLRYQKELKHDQTAYFFMPKFDYLVEWAKKIMEQIDVVVEEKTKIPPPPPPPPPPQRKEGFLIESEVNGQTTIYDGNDLDSVELDNVHEWLKNMKIDVTRSKVPMEHYIQIYKNTQKVQDEQKHRETLFEEEQEKKFEEIDTQSMLDKLKGIAKRKVGQLYYITKIDYAIINQTYNDKFRNGRSASGNDLTINDLKQKISWLDECHRQKRLVK